MNTGLQCIQTVKTGIATFSFMGIHFSSSLFFLVQIKPDIYYQQEIKGKTYIKAKLKTKRKKPL